MNGPTLALALAISALSGCPGVGAGLKKAAIIEYDQVANFHKYHFDEAVPVGNGVAENMTAEGAAFWATFVICSIRNEGSQAGTFDFDVNSFFVDFGGLQQFFQPPKNDQFSLDTSGSPNVDEGLAAQAFQTETRRGNDHVSFPPGFNAAVEQRFAIWVKPGNGDGYARRLLLRFKGAPVILISRNRDAEELDPGRRSNLPSICRPPFK